MLSPSTSMHRLLFLAIATALVGMAHPSIAQAQSLTGEGNAAGAQCEASGVNDNGVAVGACSPNSASNAADAWVAETPGTETVLPSLASGQPCSAVNITNAGIITGACANANNVSFGVTWNATSPGSAPLQLNPIPGLLGLLADVSTTASAYDQAGNVVGESISGSGNGTTVLWPTGSGTPIAVSNRGDNCSPIDVNNTLVGGQPTVVLNCPNSNGTTTADVAQATGLLGTYAMTALPIPTGSTHCVVSAINDSAQIIGTCHFPAPDIPVATFWANPTSTPVMLSSSTLPVHTRTAGGLINRSGLAIVVYQNTSGKSESAYWDTNSGTVTLIAPLQGGSTTFVTGLADNGTAALVSEDSNENGEAAFSTPSGGTNAAGFFGGGQESSFGAISPSGSVAVGQAEDSSENSNAVTATIP